MSGLAVQAGMMRGAGGKQSLTLTIDTREEGSAENQFQLPTTNFATDDYVVAWGDGSLTHVIGTAAPLKSYSVGGIYTVEITGYINQVYFNDSGDKKKVLTVVYGGAISTSLAEAFFKCPNIYSVSGHINENITSIRNIHYGAQITAWSIPLHEGLIDLTAAWQRCKMTEWVTPIPTTVTSLKDAWNSNKFTEWNTKVPPNVTTTRATWRLMGSLVHVAPGIFDNCPLLTDMSISFDTCSLSEEAVDNILISVNTNLTSGGLLDIDRGTNATPSAAGKAAADALRSRGWKVLLNGY